MRLVPVGKMTSMCRLQEEYGGRGALLLAAGTLYLCNRPSARAQFSSKEAFWGLQLRHRYNGGEIDVKRSLCGESIDSTLVVTHLPGLSILASATNCTTSRDY